MILRGIYEEIMADLTKKGFGGLVESIDHDYKNDDSIHQPPYGTTYTAKTKTKNEKYPAGSFLLSGGDSLPSEVAH